MANVFNTFSFNKWADTKKEEEIDKESRRRRHEQIKRLKDKLRRERELRELGLNGAEGEMDLDALIEVLQNGESINADSQPFENWHHGQYYPGTRRGPEYITQPPPPSHHKETSTRGLSATKREPPPETEKEEPEEISDDYILEEIRKYSGRNGGSIAGFAEKRANSAKPSSSKTGPPSSATLKKWQYNRRLMELQAAEQTRSEPSSPSSRKSSAGSRAPSAQRGSSAVSSGRNPSARPARAFSADRFQFNRYVTHLP